MRQVKGLEFHNVLLWNPRDKAYPQKRQGRNLLYVAVTRAEENLAVVTWNRPSKLLPPLHSRFVRGIRVAFEDHD